MPQRSQISRIRGRVPGRRDQGAGRGAADRLDDEGEHGLRALPQDLLLQEIGIAAGRLLGG